MSELPSSSSAPADDFIHVALDKSVNSLSDSYSSRSQYCQVVFHDLSEVYPTDGDVCFTYSFQSGVIPQTGDRIALYKVGWSSVSEYITSVFANPPDEDNAQKIYKITFSVESLPKDETNMYQFCYITSGNIVAGSSIPFTFRKPLGNELVAVEDPNDSGLVVFRSRVTQLQEQLLKSNTEKESLDKTIRGLSSELYLAKSELNERNKKFEIQIQSIKDMTAVIYDLNTEKKELMEKLEAAGIFAKRSEELEELKTSLESEITSLKDIIETHSNEIKSKEVIINGLKEVIERLEESIALLNKQLNSTEESSKSTSESLSAQLQQANDTISHFRTNMEEMEKTFEEKLLSLKTKFNEEKQHFEEQVKNLKSQLNESIDCVDQMAKAMNEREKELNVESQNLNQKLQELSQHSNSSTAEVVTLTDELKKAKSQITTLEDMLKSKDRVLQDILENTDNSNENLRKILLIEDDNSILLVKVCSLEERLESRERDNAELMEKNKELKQEKIIMAEQLSRMNEELRNLKHGEFQSQAKSSAHSSSQGSHQDETNKGKSPFSFTFPFFGPFQGGGASFNVSANCPENPCNSQCDKCVEYDAKVKNLMREKADIRSDLIQIKHANEEYCKHLKNASEESAALRSRVAVLEMEVRKAKEVSLTKEGEQKYMEYMGAFGRKKPEDSMNSSSEFRSSFDTIDVTALVNQNEELKKQLEKEIEVKQLVQRNVESLMLSEANHFVQVDKLKKTNTKLMLELLGFKEKNESVTEIGKAMDEMERSNSELQKEMEKVTSEKVKLETQIIGLRKELVGKVSLGAMQELRDENKALKQQLVEKQKSQDSMDGWSIPLGLSSAPKPSTTQNQPELVPINEFTCQVCGVSFPPDSFDAFNKHFKDHLD